ncbi:alpha/beta hydrolase fold domain-containing protein [Kribbella sp. NPDC050124]|uniref:alpha/beta hydrolase fold domain-containing protein n=1 Tax=Kribbella sp. NPDC050124 TaxID=3364114 RepID=UPI003789E114
MGELRQVRRAKQRPQQMRVLEFRHVIDTTGDKMVGYSVIESAGGKLAEQPSMTWLTELRPDDAAADLNVQQNDYRGFHFAATSADLEASIPSPALDPAVMFVAQTLAEQGFPGFRAVGVDAGRGVVESFVEMQTPAAEIAHHSEHAYGPDPEQRLRIYRPSLDTNLPVVVHLHGGGFVLGSLAVVDEVARDLACRTGAVVVSGTYRRAPEHRFPAAHDDALAILQWVRENIAEHGGDPDRIALIGDSAGGNLAAATALAASAAAIPISALALIYPLIGLAIDTPSRRDYARGYVIEFDDVAWLGEQYAASETDVTDPRLALDRVELSGLAGLPPTLLVTNEFDTLRDEAEVFAERLKAAGVDTTLVRSPGLAHGVFWLSLAVARCAEQREVVSGFLATRLAGQPKAVQV